MIQGGSAIGGFEVAQDLVAAFDGGVQRFLGGLAARKQGFEFLVDHGTGLGQVPKRTPLELGVCVPRVIWLMAMSEPGLAS